MSHPPWSGSFTQDGVTYNVSAQVNVQVATSEDAAVQTGAQNVIGLQNGPADAAHNINSEVFTKSLWTKLLGGPDRGIWNFNTLGQDSGHEFTHLLGVFDKSGAVLSNTNILNDFSIPHTATSSDFRWGILEATSAVNHWVHAPPYQAMRHGEVFPKPTVFTDRTNVGAPLRWWK